MGLFFFYEINTTLFKGTILNFELEIWSNNMKKHFRKDKTVPEAHQIFFTCISIQIKTVHSFLQCIIEVQKNNKVLVLRMWISMPYLKSNLDHCVRSQLIINITSRMVLCVCMCACKFTSICIVFLWRPKVKVGDFSSVALHFMFWGRVSH